MRPYKVYILLIIITSRVDPAMSVYPISETLKAKMFVFGRF